MITIDWQSLGLSAPPLMPIQGAGSRLNLVLPGLFNRWSYGGIPTAIRLFERLAKGFDSARIILTHQSSGSSDVPEEGRWPIDNCTSVQPRSVHFGGGAVTPLGICNEEFFIATLWTTAIYTGDLLDRHSRAFDQKAGRFVYLIQDYEPGFYPWSTEYVLAESTYRNNDRSIAVINSNELATYFRNQGFAFPEQYVFEPKLHPKLRERRGEASNRKKEKVILVYGRPSQSRNAFNLVVESLRIWAATFQSAREWRVISAGETHDDIPLSEGVSIKSKGKLSLDEYAEYLSVCWAGVSFMISPHPSYPPLEMAEFGAWVVTNTFANKNLSDRIPNILSVTEASPGVIAGRLAWCCSLYQSGCTAVLEKLPPAFQSDTEEFPFWRELIQSWQTNACDRT